MRTTVLSVFALVLLLLTLALLYVLGRAHEGDAEMPDVSGQRHNGDDDSSKAWSGNDEAMKATSRGSSHRPTAEGESAHDPTKAGLERGSSSDSADPHARTPDVHEKPLDPEGNQLHDGAVERVFTPIIINAQHRESQARVLARAFPGAVDAASDDLALSGDGRVVAVSSLVGATVMSAQSGEVIWRVKLSSACDPSLSYDGSVLCLRSSLDPAHAYVVRLEGSGSFERVLMRTQAMESGDADDAPLARLQMNTNATQIVARFGQGEGRMTAAQRSDETWGEAIDLPLLDRIDAFAMDGSSEISAWSLRGSSLYRGLVDGTFSEVQTHVHPPDALPRLIVSPNGHHVALLDASTLQIIDIGDGRVDSRMSVKQGRDKGTKVAIGNEKQVYLALQSVVLFGVLRAKKKPEELTIPERFDGIASFIALCVSLDSQTLAVLDAGNSRVWVWDLASKSLRFGDDSDQDKLHANVPTSIDWSPDGKRIVTQDGQRVYLWNVERRELERVLETELDREREIELYLRSAEQLPHDACFSGGSGSVIVATDVITQEFDLDSPEAESRVLVVESLSHGALAKLHVMQAGKGYIVNPFPALEDEYCAMWVGTKQFEVGGDSGMAIIESKQFSISKTATIYQWLDSEEAILATMRPGDRFLILRDDQSKPELLAFQHSLASDACLTQDGKWLLSCHAEGLQLSSRDNQHVSMRVAFGAGRQPLICEALSGARVALCTANGELFVLDLALLAPHLIALQEANPSSLDAITPKPLTTIDALEELDESPILSRRHAHDAAVTGLCVSPDGSEIATVARDGSLKIWEVE